MRAHGGRVGLDSQKGKGTVVTLQFPQKQRKIRLLEGGR
jgi:signal transduction histidine kinase